MQNSIFIFLLIGAALLCGCDNQTKLNTEKIAALSQRLVVLQEVQSRQLATLQSELTALAPMLEQTNSYLFEKSHADAFFYHTNTLYLLLLVDNKIESELQVAAIERAADKVKAFEYHTNEVETLRLFAAQSQASLAGEENRLATNIIAETTRTVVDQGNELLEQIKLLAPDSTETARREQLAADVAQMKRDLDQIKSHFGMTNPPSAGP